MGLGVGAGGLRCGGFGFFAGFSRGVLGLVLVTKLQGGAGETEKAN